MPVLGDEEWNWKFELSLLGLLVVGLVIAFFAAAGIVSLTPVTWDHVGGAVLALLLILVVEAA